MADRTDIYVYADWVGMVGPKLIGTLSAQQAKGRKSFSFTYQKDWIASHEQFLLDPDIAWFGGAQYPNQKENFGVLTAGDSLQLLISILPLTKTDLH